MSMDQLAPLVFGTASVLVIIVAFFFVVRYVRNHFFPSQASDKLDGAMLEMQILQAQLEAKAEEGEETPVEDEEPASSERQE